MFALIIIGIAALSVLMALWSLQRQNKMEEVHKIKKELRRKKIIFQRGSRT